MTRRLMASTAVAAAALAATAGFTAFKDPATVEAPYVAMGDSYSSGAKIAPVVADANPRCGRSERSYSRIIVQRTTIDELTDVTCSGARTRHLRTPQHPGVGPQQDALSDRTRLVTMTLGANDRRVFGRSITDCIALSSRAPAGNPCQQRFGDSFRRDITDVTYPNLVTTLRDVREAAPNAQVAIVGYPQIVPAKGSRACTAATHIAQGDIAYLHDIHRSLNSTVRRAARVAGVTYVDMESVSAGRDACQSPSRRWVEPLVAVNASSFHPNEQGERAMATQIIERLNLPR